MISAELTASVGTSVAPGATWGIPGPPFLAMFVAAAVLAVAAVLFVRTAATRGTAPANTRTAGGSPPPRMIQGRLLIQIGGRLRALPARRA